MPRRPAPRAPSCRRLLAAARWACAAAVVGGALGGCGPDAADADQVRTWLDQARREVAYQGFADAHALYARAQPHTTPGGDAWAEAMFGRGVCAQQMTPHTADRLAEARAAFDELLAHAPGHRAAPRAMLHLARLDELVDYAGDTPDPEAAARWYRRVRRAHPDTPEAAEATLRLAALHVRPHEPDGMRRGAAVLEAWLADHGDGPLASGMWEYLAETYHKLGDHRRAVDAMVRADEAGLLLDANPMNQYWFIAHLAHRHTGQRDLAVRYYRRLIEDPAVSVGGRGYDAQKALIEMGVAPPLIPGQRALDPTLRRLRDRARPGAPLPAEAAAS